MDAKLRQDLERFFRVYQSNVNDILAQKLPTGHALLLSKELDEEFDLFRTSLMNRLSEEFN